MIENEFIELQILEVIKGLLKGQVNEVLNNRQMMLNLFEISEFKDGSAVVPIITVSGCEKTEKERIIRLDAYSVTISFNLRETPETELYCYAYTTAVNKVIRDYPSLGGIVDRVVVIGTKVEPPKVANCGMDWKVEIKLRITVETMNNVS